MRELFEDDSTARLSMGRVLAAFTTVALFILAIIDAYGKPVSEGLAGLMVSGYLPLIGGQVKEGIVNRKPTPVVTAQNVENVSAPLGIE